MRQRGIALLTAIVVVAIATVLAVHIGTRAALDLRRTQGLVALDQGWQVALGAEAWAAEALAEDLEESPDSDHLGEAWAQPLPPLPVDGGELRGALEDMQGRFNLNNLVDANGEVNEDAVGRFERLLVFVGAQPRWARLMVDWIDSDTLPEIPDGAEDSTYLSQVPPYRTANLLVTTTTEMMALPGMTRDEFERIRPYVAALPVGTRINVCTAKAPVLAALVEGGTDFGDAELLATNRKGGCFPTLADLQATVALPEWQALSKVISEKSNWFRVVTAVRIGTSETTLYSLIERNGPAGIRTAIRSTGTE
ncbi:MAG TPA: type II secretion system minor pseudopilin GspK [Steroidobacteraceae bacterium]|jgi:general secretion pathway protein K|nr:type II secretion system minor pseudopilin GspK [Steroidobacteraceae bacterium]